MRSQARLAGIPGVLLGILALVPLLAQGIALGQTHVAGPAPVGTSASGVAAPVRLHDMTPVAAPVPSMVRHVDDDASTLDSQQGVEPVSHAAPTRVGTAQGLAAASGCPSAGPGQWGGAAASPAGATAGIEFCCPVTDLPMQPNTDSLDRFDYRSCPFRIYDGATQAANYYLGNPAIAVNPADEREVAFLSLHSAPYADGPTPRSREASQSHTIFTSADQGINWQDQPITSGEALGEAGSITMDDAGNLYWTYLWNEANGNATTGYHSIVCMYKGGNTHTPGSVLSSYGRRACAESRGDHNPVDQANVVYVASYHEPEPVPDAGNATLGPGTVGQEAEPVDHGLDRVVALWHERAVDWRNSTTGMSAWIDYAITTTAANRTSSAWVRAASGDHNGLIGPCRDASNPVAFHGKVYVACVVDQGYTGRSRARVGDIDIWRIDPLTGNSSWLAFTGLIGGHPMLASSTDGYMVLVTQQLVGPSDGLTLHSAFGWYGDHWALSGPDLGPQLHRMDGNRDLLDARVTGLAISDKEHTAALIYMEWQKTENVTTVPQPPTGVPSAADPEQFKQLKDYRKTVVTFNACDFPIAAAALQLGTAVDPTNYQAYQQVPSIFDDEHDGLVAYTERATGADLFYMAADDYGAIQFAGIRVASASSVCVSPPPLPTPPVPAIPQALTLSNPALTVTGAALGASALASVGYIVLAKRKVAMFAAAEDK